jgi:putative flippase GtrA
MSAETGERVAAGRWSVQFLRYALVGAAGTLAQYVILVVLVEAGWAGVVAASTLGAIAGALVNYALNRRYTFASDSPHVRSLPRFMLVAAAGIVVNAAVLALLERYTALPYLVSQVIATAFVLVAGFVANRTWSF